MLTAADVMTTEVVSVEPDTPVRDIAELLYTRRISGVPVVEHDHVIGIVSEGDLIGHTAAIGEQRRSWWLSLFADESLSARDYAKTHGRAARDVMTASVVSVEETRPWPRLPDSLNGIGSSAFRCCAMANSWALSPAATCSRAWRP